MMIVFSRLAYDIHMEAPLFNIVQIWNALSGSRVRAFDDERLADRPVRFSRPAGQYP
jgi:hypothetical protein